MIRILWLLGFIFVLHNAALAQTSQGTMVLGGQANVNMHNSTEDKVLQADISPNLLVFVQDKLAVGGSVELGFIRYEGNRYNTLGIFPSARYYMGQQQQARMFLLGDVGYHLTSYTIEEEGTARSGLGLGGGPGFAYFYRDVVSLEGLAKARAIRYTDGTNSLQFQLRMGVQIYLKPRRF